MATIVKPQVLVFQEFSLVPSEVTQPLRAHISGPNADLHRYADSDEKPLINVGAYDRTIDTNYTWPGRQAGSLVDQTYTRVFADDAYLLYFEDLIGVFTQGRGTIVPVAGRKNWIRSSTLSFKSNGAAFPRSALFNDRDVAIGDRVYVRGVADVGGSCDQVELWTRVQGFASDEVASSIANCREDTNNQPSTIAATVITKAGGPLNCITATADGSAYDGLEDGEVTEVYTIEVITSGIAGCQAARLRVTSASGTDNEAEVTPAAFASPTDIGTRGLTVTFDNTGDSSCSSMASAGDVSETQLVVGQRWQITVTQDFTKGCCESGGTYGGTSDDVYIVEVTKGGIFADLPEVTVTTVRGLDFSGPTTITGVDTAVAIGSQGVTFSVRDCWVSSSSSSAPSGPISQWSAAGPDPAGLLTGDKFLITVTAAVGGALQTLMLDHDIPDEILSATDLDLRLFLDRDGLEISENRVSSPPNVNWTQESTQLIMQSGVELYDSTWTASGVPLPLTLWSATLFIEYREWLVDLTDEVASINDTADIDNIEGPLHPDNPLKWGVYKALQNCGGTHVRYTAVADPDDSDDWQAVLDLIDGRDDLYNLVPLTNNTTVLGLYQAHVASESSETAGNWKAMFLGITAVSNLMLVGESTAAVQALTPTSTDGEVVLAALEDDPNASGTQYTLLSVPAANSGFITYGVFAGDIVRFLFTTDAWGTESYTEFVVDTVLSENSLLLLTGNAAPVSEPQKMEIWHVQEKDELVTAIKAVAQSYSDRRVCAVWPDLVGTGSFTTSGYYLCAALAGLASGSAPHRPLTNVAITGFDNVSSRTNDYFSDSQLDDMDDGGVWVVQEDRDGRVHTRHALTTDVTDLNRREESIRRNVDAISYLFLNRLSPFIGVSNVTPGMLDRLEYEVEQGVEFLKTSGYTQEIGSQLIDGVIRAGYPRVHPLLADRVEIVMDIDVPEPLNNIELHLVV